MKIRMGYGNMNDKLLNRLQAIEDRNARAENFNPDKISCALYDFSDEVAAMTLEEKTAYCERLSEDKMIVTVEMLEHMAEMYKGPPIYERWKEAHRNHEV